MKTPKWLIVLGVVVGLASGSAGRLQAAANPTVAANAAQVLNDSLQTMYARKSSADYRYYADNTWRSPNYHITERYPVGLGGAAGVLFQWRQYKNYTATSADQALNVWTRSTAIASINRAIADYLNTDGSIDPGSGPETQFLAAELAVAYVTLNETLDANSRKIWRDTLLRMTSYLIKVGELPNASKTGWEATDGWYTNGNIELLETEFLYLAWLVTGDQRFKDLFELQLAHTQNPDQSKWGGWGLATTTQTWTAPPPGDGLPHSDTPIVPTLADGSDGLQWLTESSGGSNFGYDGDYTHMQTKMASRLYAFSGDIRALKLTNVLTNQVWSYTNTSTFSINATNGVRHSLSFPNHNPGFATVTWLTGNTAYSSYVASHFNTTLQPELLNHAAQNTALGSFTHAYSATLGLMLHMDMLTNAIPRPPANVTAQATAGAVKLNWNHAISLSAQSYKVKRAATSGGPYTQIATDIRPQTYTDTSVVNGISYYYVISAVNQAGESVNSAAVTASPQATALPHAPATLVANADNLQASLSWLPAAGATSYNLKRSLSSGSGYTTVASGLTLANLVPYTDTGLTNGVTYYYVVTGVNANGEGPASTEASVTPQIISTPRSLLAIPSGSTSITLTWNTVRGARYNLKRSTTSGSGYTTVVSDYTGRTYVDTVPSNNITYYYVVTAEPSAGGTESPASAQAAAIASAVATPDNLIANRGNAQVALTWAPSVPSIVIPYSSGSSYAFRLVVNVPAHTYSIYVTPPGGTEITVGTNYAFRTEQNTVTSLAKWNAFVLPDTPGSVTISNFGTTPTVTATPTSGWHNNALSAMQTGTFTVTFNATPSANNSNAVIGLSSGNAAAYSDMACAVRFSPTGAIDARNGSAYQATGSQISYTVKRGTGGAYTALAGGTGLLTTSYTDSTAVNGTTYYYRVFASQGTANSADSVFATATPTTALPPAAPTGLSATPSSTQVSLSWGLVAGATSYNVKKSLLSGGEYTTIASGLTTPSYVDTRVSSGKTYHYVVSSSNANGGGVDTTQVSATVP